MKTIILLSSLLMTTSLSIAQLNVGLMAKYYFNSSNTNDDLGVVNGTNSNAYLATDRFGCPNKAYQFNPDSTSFISLGDSFDSFIAGADQQFSISLWFNTLGNDNTDNPMIAKYGHTACGEDQRQFGFELNGSNRMSFMYTSTLAWSSAIEMQGNTVINDVNWHHAVVNYDGTIDSNNGEDRVQIYLDNNAETMSLQGSWGTTSEIQDGNAHVGIGAPVSSSGSYCAGIDSYDGLLDDIRFYDRLLTSVEVDSLYNETSPCLGNLIDETKNISTLKLFPNPATDRINIKSSLTIAQIIIYDMRGKVIMEFENQAYFDVSALNKGLFTIKIVSSDNIEQYSRFSKL